jgi:hypothetical protein
MLVVSTAVFPAPGTRVRTISIQKGRQASQEDARDAAHTDILDELPTDTEFPIDPEKERLQARVEELEAFEPLITAIGMGEVNVVEAGPAVPDPAHIVGYRARVTLPDAPEVIEDLRLYKKQLEETDPSSRSRARNLISRKFSVPEAECASFVRYVNRQVRCRRRMSGSSNSGRRWKGGDTDG